MHVEGIHILQLNFKVALQRIVRRENNFFLIDEAVDRNTESDDAVRGFLRMLHQLLDQFRDMGEGVFCRNFDAFDFGFIQYYPKIWFGR